MHSKHCNIEIIPTELVTCILLHLEPKDVYSCLMLSKDWNFKGDNEVFWKLYFQLYFGQSITQNNQQQTSQTQGTREKGIMQTQGTTQKGTIHTKLGMTQKGLLNEHVWKEKVFTKNKRTKSIHRATEFRQRDKETSRQSWKPSNMKQCNDWKSLFQYRYRISFHRTHSLPSIYFENDRVAICKSRPGDYHFVRLRNEVYYSGDTTVSFKFNVKQGFCGIGICHQSYAYQDYKKHCEDQSPNLFQSPKHHFYCGEFETNRLNFGFYSNGQLIINQESHDYRSWKVSKDLISIRLVPSKSIIQVNQNDEKIAELVTSELTAQQYSQDPWILMCILPSKGSVAIQHHHFFPLICAQT